MAKRLNAYLSDGEILSLIDKLVSERERILKGIDDKQGLIEIQPAERKDSVDEANDNILINHQAREANRSNLYLKKIKKSLDKIEKGEYGLCDDCGAEIPFRRLMARLTSELCIVCKEESEQKEMGSIFGRRSKSLGKEVRFAN